MALTLKLLGDFTPDDEGSFDPKDCVMVTSPQWQERVVRLFENSPYNINLLIVGDRLGGLLKIAGPEIYGKKAFRKGKKPPFRQRLIMEHLYGDSGFYKNGSVQYKKDAINVMLTFNESFPTKQPLTPWMVGHRMIHAMTEPTGFKLVKVNSHYLGARNRLRCTRDDCSRLLGPKGLGIFSNFIPDISDEEMELIKKISPFRSGRMGLVRNKGEFLVDSMTHYLINGSIKFGLDEAVEKKFNNLLASFFLSATGYRFSL